MSCQLENNHVLKFVIRGRTFKDNVGIQTFPQQTYGVSEDSPDHFKGKHSLKAENGYIYKHENTPGFDYFSQKKYMSVIGTYPQNQYEQIKSRRLSNPICFHRKKGRLTEFMDKNGWMSPVCKIMGDERSQTARELSNNDREKRIKSLKPKVFYENKTALKPKHQPEYSETIADLMSEKLRIRSSRNVMAESIVPATARIVPTPHFDKFQVENVSQKMAKTAMDWYSTLNSSSKKCETSKIERRRDLRLLKRQINLEEQIQNSPRKTLQSWYRTTCSSKWAYNPKKNDEEEDYELNMQKSVKL